MVRRDRWRWKGVREEQLRELALPEGDNVLLVAFLVIALHLHALTKVHQAFVDLASFSESCSSGLCLTGAFGAYIDY